MTYSISNAYHTRVAPSPTGAPHLGTVRTAYMNWLAARSSGGTFTLRIDDTDAERSRQEYVDMLFDTLEWLDLQPDVVEYQSKTFDVYEAMLEALTKSGHTLVLDNGAVALRWDDRFPTSWHDTIVGNVLITDAMVDQIDEKLILKRGDGGNYTYQFASAVDDVRLGINYIIRGTDHQSNTPKQMAIIRAIELAAEDIGIDIEPINIKFSHVGLIMHKGKKLSKRDSEANVLSYREQGIHPQALLNWCLRFGWAEKDGKTRKKLDREMALEMFLEQGNLRASNASMDTMLLKALNKKYTNNT